MAIEIPAGAIAIDPSDYPALVKPVPVSVCMHEEMIDGRRWICWIGENKDLGIRCCVSSGFLKRSRRWNLRKLKKEILVDVDFIVDMYLVQKEPNAAPDLKRIIENWNGCADPAKYPGKTHWQVAEIEQ